MKTDKVAETVKALKSKEVAQEVLREITTSVLNAPFEALEALIGEMGVRKRIFCDGAGRSRLQAEGFAMRLAQMGFCSNVVGAPTTPAITEQDLLLILSGSGETPTLVEHAVKAKEIGAGIILMTTNEKSSLGGLSDVIIPIKAAAKDEKRTVSIQPMGSLFEQSVGILCDIAVLLLMKRHCISSEQMYKNHSNLE